MLKTYYLLMFKRYIYYMNYKKLKICKITILIKIVYQKILKQYNISFVVLYVGILKYILCLILKYNTIGY